MECLEALEQEKSAWKHLSKRERRELEREISRLGGVPTDLSTKGAKKA